MRVEVDSTDGFSVGDVVLISSHDMSMMDLRTVVGFGSIMIDKPLQHAYEPGALVRLALEADSSTPSPSVAFENETATDNASVALENETATGNSSVAVENETATGKVRGQPFEETNAGSDVKVAMGAVAGCVGLGALLLGVALAMKKRGCPLRKTLAAEHVDAANRFSPKNVDGKDLFPRPKRLDSLCHKICIQGIEIPDSPASQVVVPATPVGRARSLGEFLTDLDASYALDEMVTGLVTEAQLASPMRSPTKSLARSPSKNDVVLTPSRGITMLAESLRISPRASEASRSSGSKCPSPVSERASGSRGGTARKPLRYAFDTYVGFDVSREQPALSPHSVQGVPVSLSLDAEAVCRMDLAEAFGNAVFVPFDESDGSERSSSLEDVPHDGPSELHVTQPQSKSQNDRPLEDDAIGPRTLVHSRLLVVPHSSMQLQVEPQDEDGMVARDFTIDVIDADDVSTPRRSADVFWKPDGLQLLEL